MLLDIIDERKAPQRSIDIYKRIKEPVFGIVECFECVSGVCRLCCDGNASGVLWKTVCLQHHNMITAGLRLSNKPSSHALIRLELLLQTV